MVTRLSAPGDDAEPVPPFPRASRPEIEMQPTKKIEESFDFSDEQLRPPSAFPQFLPPPVSSTLLFSSNSKLFVKNTRGWGGLPLSRAPRFAECGTPLPLRGP